MDIKRKTYDRYRLDWMTSHGITLEVINKTVSEFINEKVQDPECEMTFSEYVAEHGLNGMIWACFEEFLECEYKDATYVRTLLSNADYTIYLYDICKAEAEGEHYE